MRIARDADSALRRYLRTRETLIVPSTSNMRAMEGYIHAARCARCARSACWIDREPTKKNPARSICRHCGAAWHRVEAWIPPGVINARVRPDGKRIASTASRARSRYRGDTRLVELVTLERIIFRAPRNGQRVDGRAIRTGGVKYWRFSVSNWISHLAEGATGQEIADRGRRLYPSEAWNASRVLRSITFARHVVEERLVRIDSSMGVPTT